MSAWVCLPHNVRDDPYCRSINDPLADPAGYDPARWTTVPDPASNPWPADEVPPVGSDIPSDPMNPGGFWPREYVTGGPS